MRPFFFMAPFWGAPYRRRFVDLCLPSLLAPRNLPRLSAADGHRFLIATTREDWDAIRDLPIVRRLDAHAPPVHVEFDPGSPVGATGSRSGYATTIKVLDRAFKALFDATYPHRPFGCLALPDLVFSDGLVAELLAAVEAGDQLVLLPAMRQSAERVCDELIRAGLLPADGAPSATGAALAVKPRFAAGLAVRCLHPEIAVFEQDAAAAPARAPFWFWRMPGGRGLLSHMFNAWPVLMDFAALKPDHADCLDRDSYENVYLRTAFADCRRIRVLRDSDQAVLLSLTPESVNRAAAAPAQIGVRIFRAIDQMCMLRDATRFFVGARRSSVVREIVREPIRWHVRDIDGEWRAAERRAERQVTRAIGDYLAGGADMSAPYPAFPSGEMRFLAVDLLLLLGYASWRTLWLKRRLALRRLGLAARGDAGTWRWLIWRARVAAMRARGRVDHPPRPD